MTNVSSNLDLDNNSMGDPLENLLPILVQCFGVILIGYLAKRLRCISQETNVLGEYVTKFALPALFFRSMATIDFSGVNWMFIVAIFLSKLVMFLTAIIITCLVTKPVNLALAGILSMFISQTNDFALGYPILEGMYPDLAEYVYLFAPVQLVLLNPFCFVLLEIHESKLASSNHANDHNVSWKSRVLLIIKKVVFNPLVFMTVFGVLINFICHHNLPPVIDLLLKVFGESFTGVTLFYLGINMVGKLSSFTAKSSFLIFLLILGKLLLMPFVTREIVLHTLSRSMNQSDYLNFTLVGFFYGGLPTAPPVYIVADTFQVIPEIIAAAMVLTTFLSGPTMFITGRIISIISMKPMYNILLRNTAAYISAISIIGAIWVLIVFLLGRKWRSILHRTTLVYCVFVLLSCTGLIIGRIISDASGTESLTDMAGWVSYIQFTVFFIGVTGARIWTAILALAIFIINWKGIALITRIFSHLLAFGVCLPVLVTSFLLIFSKHQKVADIDPSFQFGKAQLVTSLVVLICCLLITVSCLVLQSRWSVSVLHSNKIADSNNNATLITSSTESSPSHASLLPRDEQQNNNCNIQSLNDQDGPNCIKSRQKSVCSDEDTEDICAINADEEADMSLEIPLQMNHHLILLVLLVVNMGFGFFLCIWRLVQETVDGIYIELEFLDCAFNFGQGFLLWTVFGLDFKIVLVPYLKIMKLWENISGYYIPPEGHLSTEVTDVKTEFKEKYFSKCKVEICRGNRRDSDYYADSFTGKELIDWLVRESIELNRVNARRYAQRLLIGRVIYSVQLYHKLTDDHHYLYKFSD